MEPGAARGCRFGANNVLQTSRLFRATALSLFLLLPKSGLAQAQRSLTLEETIRRVLDTHPSIGAAAEAVEASRGTRLTARSWANPILNYEIEHEPAPGSHSIPVMERKTMAFAMLPLEPIYQISARSEKTSAEVRRSEGNLRETRRLLVLRATSVFFRTAAAEVAVEANQEVRVWLDSLIAYTRTRVEEGVAAEADLIRLEVEQGRVETDVAMATVPLHRARSARGGLVGFDTVAIARGVDSVFQPVALPAIEVLLEAARMNRPDLAAADANVDAMRAGVRVERTAVVRELGVMAGVMTMSGERSLMAGISMPLPLFDQNRGEIRRASAEQRAAVLERSLVGRQLVADVVTAHAAVRELSMVVARLGTGFVRRAEEGRRIAEGAYREGATPLVQVLDAARAFAEARMVYARASFALRESLIELNVSLGTEDLSALTRMEGR